MHITGFVTCVGYADYLARGLALWKAGLDELVVVTNGEPATMALTSEHEVATLATSAFEQDGALFNKAASLDEAIDWIRPREWILLFDADVVPPADWRDVTEAGVRAHRLAVEWTPSAIYGAHRQDEAGVLFPEPEIGGYFHLWRAQDPRWSDDPHLGSWTSASGYDSALLQRWPYERRVYLPLTLTHLGPTGENWCGRERGKTAVEALQAHRQAAGPGSWKRERLDRQ